MDKGKLINDNEQLKVKESTSHYQLSTLNSPLVKEGYKQTEVGVIPEDWEYSELSKIAKVIDSLHQTPVFSEDGYPMVRVADIKQGNLDLSTALKVSEIVFLEFTRGYKPQRGDIVLSRVGTYGVSSFVETDEEFCLGQSTVVIKCSLPARFLYYVLNSTVVQKQIEDGSYGSGYKSLSLKNIKDLNIFYPPADKEQKAIAKALSDMDALIEAQKKLIAKKQAIKTATMQQLLTGKTRLRLMENGKWIVDNENKHRTKQTELGEIPEDWEVEQLGNLGDFKNGINKSKEDFGYGYPFVNLMDVFGVLSITSNSGFGLINSSDLEKKTYDLKAGDVIFIRSSVKPSGVGLTSVITVDLPDTVYSGFLIRFRDNGCLDIGFKTYCYHEEGFRNRLISASTVSANTNINQESLKLLRIIIPKSQKEQKAIAKVLSDMDKELEALELKLKKTKSIKQGMMQELLTGKTRLV